MGNRWTVSAWLPDQPGGYGPEQYGYVEVAAVQHLIVAAFAAWRAKRGGAGCVRVEWR